MKNLSLIIPALFLLGCGQEDKKSLTHLEQKHQQSYKYIGKSVGEVSKWLGVWIIT